MRPIRSFGRTRSRPLSRNQAELLESNLASLLVPNDIRLDFVPIELMPSAKEVWVEIGFGGAEHLIKQAQNNPDVLFIGAEPFIEGVAKAVKEIEVHGIKNIRLINADVRPFLNCLADNTLERIFILFPDPWQKSKHNKRRLINKSFVEDLVRILKPAGKLRFATDWADYANKALAVFLGNKDLEWGAEVATDWQTPKPDHFTTRYETKGLGDCKPMFFDFEKISPDLAR
ncbi:MAG: tRNA (guanine-N7-)-methyltransferase [Hyphomonadaceae bacterium]|nr:MAG: tRNA (guanine-N7-)-methyltransferase [Hyphomonadaceae bacterium]KAF0187048.1 MAG: tRNA (guanine-N7-)-methyltransferase [Hyphomonadaceae bacterium]